MEPPIQNSKLGMVVRYFFFKHRNCKKFLLQTEDKNFHAGENCKLFLETKKLLILGSRYRIRLFWINVKSIFLPEIDLSLSRNRRSSIALLNRFSGDG